MLKKHCDSHRVPRRASCNGLKFTEPIIRKFRGVMFIQLAGTLFYPLSFFRALRACFFFVGVASFFFFGGVARFRGIARFTNGLVSIPLTLVRIFEHQDECFTQFWNAEQAHYKLCLRIHCSPLGFWGIALRVRFRFRSSWAFSNALSQPVHVLLDRSKNIQI